MMNSIIMPAPTNTDAIRKPLAAPAINSFTSEFPLRDAT